jgi:hypothetical protein
MAKIWDDQGRSQPGTPVSGDEESESVPDLRFHMHGRKNSAPNDTNSDLGEEKPVKRREPGTWEVVKRWDPRQTEQKDIDKEVLELSNQYIELSGTKELPGFYRKDSDRLAAKEEHVQVQRNYTGNVLIAF